MGRLLGALASIVVLLRALLNALGVGAKASSVPDDCGPQAIYRRRYIEDRDEWNRKLKMDVPGSGREPAGKERTQEGTADALQVIGKCPCCEHEMDDFVSLSPEWVGELGTKPQQVITVLACNCTERHEGRPPQQTGCGLVAVATLELSRPTRDADVATEVTWVRPATTRDRAWDDEAAKWEQAMSSRLSETAAKWGETVAAVFGLFGLALVLESDQVEKVITSQARGPWWVLDALLVVVALVLGFYWKWRREEGEPKDGLLRVAAIAAVLGALVAFGVGGVCKEPDEKKDVAFGVEILGGCEAPRAGVAFGLLAGLAVVFALGATGFAGLAAQGSPKWISYLSGDRMRRRRIEGADASVRNLRRARLATVLAVGWLAAALAVLWYAPAREPEPQLFEVSREGKNALCGEIRESSGEGVYVRPPGEQTSVLVTAQELAGVQLLDEC